MKTKLMTLFVPLFAALLISGCGKTETTPPPPAPVPDKTETAAAATAPKTTPPAAPVSVTAPAPTAPAAVTAPVADARTAAPAAASAITALSSQFTQKIAAQKDAVLASVATDLVGKVQSLSQALGAGDAAKAQLNTTMQTLLGGADTEALTTAYKMVDAAKLTPEQIGIAKEVGNLTTAFVVQRNFSALEGAQGDVATIVNSLRKGELVAAAPALQKVAQNANLTESQKVLVGTVMDKYAPGLKKSADTLKQGLQTIKQLPGFSK